MKVYVLFYNNFHGEDEFNGVFSSEEKAMERIEMFDGHSRRNFRIEEHEVDSY